MVGEGEAERQAEVTPGEPFLLFPKDGTEASDWVSLEVCSLG